MKTRMSRKFNRCVKSVRKSVKARKGSNKESAAIAICTKSVLQKRGRTLKSYRRGRLVTQRKLRGGVFGFGEKSAVAPRGPAVSRPGSVNRANLEATYADPVKRVKGMKLLISLAQQVKAKSAGVKTKEEALAATGFEVDNEGMEWVKSALDEYKKQYPPSPPTKTATELRTKLGFRTLEDSILALQTGRASLAMAGTIALAGIEATKKLGIQAGGGDEEEDDYDDGGRTTYELQQLLIATGDMLVPIVTGLFNLILAVGWLPFQLVGIVLQALLSPLFS